MRAIASTTRRWSWPTPPPSPRAAPATPGSSWPATTWPTTCTSWATWTRPSATSPRPSSWPRSAASWPSRPTSSPRRRDRPGPRRPGRGRAALQRGPGAGRAPALPERVAGLTANLGLLAVRRGQGPLAIHRLSTALARADTLGTRHLAAQIRVWLAPLLPPPRPAPPWPRPAPSPRAAGAGASSSRSSSWRRGWAGSGGRPGADCLKKGGSGYDNLGGGGAGPKALGFSLALPRWASEAGPPRQHEPASFTRRRPRPAPAPAPASAASPGRSCRSPPGPRRQRRS